MNEGTRYLRLCIINHHTLRERLLELRHEQEDYTACSGGGDDTRGHYEPQGLEGFVIRKSRLEAQFDEMLPQVNLAIEAMAQSPRIRQYIEDGVSIKRHSETEGISYRQALKQFDREVDRVAKVIGLHDGVERTCERFRHVPMFMLVPN